MWDTCAAPYWLTDWDELVQGTKQKLCFVLTKLSKAQKVLTKIVEDSLDAAAPFVPRAGSPLVPQVCCEKGKATKYAAMKCKAETCKQTNAKERNAKPRNATQSNAKLRNAQERLSNAQLSKATKNCKANKYKR